MKIVTIERQEGIRIARFLYLFIIFYGWRTYASKRHYDHESRLVYARDGHDENRTHHEREKIGLVPVIDSESGRKVVGVVTDRDLCLAVVAAGQHPDSVLVRDAMTSKNIVTCRSEDDLEKVIDCMRKNQIRRVPIVDSGGKLCGVVSTADILQRSDLQSNVTHETFKTISEPSEHASGPRAKMQHAA